MIRIPGTSNMDFYIRQYKIQEDSKLKLGRHRIAPITTDNKSGDSLNQRSNEEGIYYNDSNFSEILAEQRKKRK